MEDYTTQIYGNYNKPLNIRVSIKQPDDSWKVAGQVFFVAQLLCSKDEDITFEDLKKNLGP